MRVDCCTDNSTQRRERMSQNSRETRMYRRADHHHTLRHSAKMSWVNGSPRKMLHREYRTKRLFYPWTDSWLVCLIPWIFPWFTHKWISILESSLLCSRRTARRRKPSRLESAVTRISVWVSCSRRIGSFERKTRLSDLLSRRGSHPLSQGFSIRVV